MFYAHIHFNKVNTTVLQFIDLSAVSRTKQKRLLFKVYKKVRVLKKMMKITKNISIF